MTEEGAENVQTPPRGFVQTALRARARWKPYFVQTSRRLEGRLTGRFMAQAGVLGLVLTALGTMLSRSLGGWWLVAGVGGAAGWVWLKSKGVPVWLLRWSGAGLAWLILAWWLPHVAAGLMVLTLLLAAGLLWLRREPVEVVNVEAEEVSPAEREAHAQAVERWDALSANGKLPGTTVLDSSTDRIGWLFKLALAPGMTVSEARKYIGNLESAMHVASGSARLIPDPADASRCILRVVRRDPLEAIIPWPGPAIKSVMEPIPLGKFEDGSTVLFSLLRKVSEGTGVMMGGVTRSGKSSLLYVIVGNLVACPDVVLWVADLKDGVSFTPWTHCLGRLEIEDEGALNMIGAVERVMKARGKVLRERGALSWTPTPEEPLLVVIIDEFHELNEHMERLAKLAKKGLALGIHLLLSTQRPDILSTGPAGSAVRSQMTTGICLRVTRADDTTIILGPGRLGQGWRPHELHPRKGMFLIVSDSDEHQIPQPARSYFVSEAMVREAVKPCARGERARLDPASAKAAASLEPMSPETVEAEEPDLDAEQALLAELRIAPAGGATLADLIEASGKSRAWVYSQLPHLEKTGQAVKVGPARWKAPVALLESGS